MSTLPFFSDVRTFTLTSGESRISQTGEAQGPDLGLKTYYMARYMLKTAWIRQCQHQTFEFWFILILFLHHFTESLKNKMSQPEIVARIKYETSNAFRIDESKRPKNEGPVESFRKLNVD